jgi:hypothetical protein
MSALDEIIKEKQRVSEGLARIDAQREKLTEQLSELAATERVLARYTKGTRPGRAASAKTTATKGTAPTRSGGRQRTTTPKPAGGKRSSPTLNDHVLALAKRSKKLPRRARELARTMSAPPLPGTSGPAA